MQGSKLLHKGCFCAIRMQGLLNLIGCRYPADLSFWATRRNYKLALTEHSTFTGSRARTSCPSIEPGSSPEDFPNGTGQLLDWLLPAALVALWRFVWVGLTTRPPRGS
jgi:hypothetical protein